MSTFLIPVLYRIEGEDPTDVWEAFSQALHTDDRAVFCGSPLSDSGCESFDVRVSDADGPDGLRELEPAEGADRRAIAAAVRDFESAANTLALVSAEIAPDIRRAAVQARGDVREAMYVREAMGEART